MALSQADLRVIDRVVELLRPPAACCSSPAPASRPIPGCPRIAVSAGCMMAGARPPTACRWRRCSPGP